MIERYTNKNTSLKIAAITVVGLLEFLTALLCLTELSYGFFYFCIIPAVLLFLINKNGRLIINFDRTLTLFLVLFLLWTGIDTFIGSVYLGYSVTGRNVVQALYNLIYVVLLFDYKDNVLSFNKGMKVCGMVYSVIIIGLFVFSGNFMHIGQLYGSYRLWINSYLPVSVTHGGVPLIYVLFLQFWDKDSLPKRIIVTIAILLFPSRVSLLGALVVWVYFYWSYIAKNLKWILLIIGVIVITNIGNIIEWINVVAPALGHRLTVSWDRREIGQIVLELFKQHPVIGYGGNSLDQLYNLGDYVSFTDTNWGQTHNFIYEFIIRYGLIGLSLFLVFLVRYIIKTKNKHCKFMIILFSIMGLFQMYFRAFYYILLICMIYNLSIVLEDEKKYFANKSCEV